MSLSLSLLKQRVASIRRSATAPPAVQLALQHGHRCTPSHDHSVHWRRLHTNHSLLARPKTKAGTSRARPKTRVIADDDDGDDDHGESIDDNNDSYINERIDDHPPDDDDNIATHLAHQQHQIEQRIHLAQRSKQQYQHGVNIASQPTITSRARPSTSSTTAATPSIPAAVLAALSNDSDTTSNNPIRRVGRPKVDTITPLSAKPALPAVDISDVTVVNDRISALHVLSILTSPKVRQRYHAIDTEVMDIDLKQQSPVHQGYITCMTIYVGEDVDFGHGSRLFINTLDTIDGSNMFTLFSAYFADHSIKKVFHNYSFDAHVLMNHGISIHGFAADTMHMARLADSSRIHYSLESLSSDYLSRPKINMKDRFAKPKMKRDGTVGKVMELPPIEEIQRSSIDSHAWIDYATYDAKSTYLLREHLEKTLRNHMNPLLNSPLTSPSTLPRSPSIYPDLSILGNHMFAFYNRYWVPFGQMLVDMERRGIYIRNNYLPILEQQALQDQQKAKEIFISWAKTYDDNAQYMNIQSNVQKKHLFFGSRDSNEEFERDNHEGIIEEGKKKAKKKTTFTLRGFGLKPISYTKNQQEAISLPVLKALAGRPYATPPQYGTAYDHFSTFYPHSTSADGIAACKAIDALCAVSGINIMINTFIQPLQELRDQASRVHCSLNLNTETGRLSARKPNLQNQPALEKDIYKVRDAFAAEEGNLLIVADYGQLELRLLAHMTQCQSMIDAFAAGGDFHSRTAMGMYPYIKTAIDRGEIVLEAGHHTDSSKKRPPLLKDVYAMERRKAKILNFSIAYGKTARGLAKDWSTSVKEAESTLQRWYSDRPEVLGWQKKTIALAHQTGATFTLMGRTRLLKGINGTDRMLRAHLERAAINTPIQGGAADVVMMAMLRLHHHQRFKELGWFVILQIHDEVICEGPKESAQQAMQIVRECMQRPFEQPLLVDLVVDAKADVTWYRAK